MNSLKKIFFNLIRLIVIVYMSMIFSVSRGGGFYIGETGILYCDNYSTCRHEIGHKIDSDLGFPSRSDEFSTAILLHMYYGIKYPEGELEPYTEAILAQPGMISYSKDYSLFEVEMFSSPQEELYANLYRLADGDIDSLPKDLQKFYSKDKKYGELYDCLSTGEEIKICNKSLYVRIY